MEIESDFFFVSHGCSHFHVLENATSLITISCSPWWKELVFLLFELFPPLTCPSPELGTQQAKQPVSHGGQSCHCSLRAQGAVSASREANCIWQELDYHSSGSCVPRLLIMPD